MRPLSSQKRGRFLRPQFSFEKVVTQITEENFSAPELEETPVLFQQAFIGETISLVYAPFFIQTGTLFEGLGDLRLGRVTESDFESIPTLGLEGLRQVRFLPVICPFCGADLQGEKDTQVLLCRNCDRVWDYSRDELKQIDFKTLKDSGEKTQTFYLPFWRIRVKISGWPGQMPRPLSRPLLDSEQSPEGESEEGNLYWLPAFKLSPSLFLTVSKAASFRQPLAPIYLDTLPQGQYYPVTLPWDQAAEGLNAVIADFIKTRPLSKLSPINIEPADHLLIYIPFHTQGNELVHQGMSLGLSRTALHFGRFL